MFDKLRFHISLTFQQQKTSALCKFEKHTSDKTSLDINIRI